MSRVERARIEHARDRLTRRGARPPFFDPPPHVEASMPEEFARFCGENVLIFNTVERAPRRVKDINEAISQAKSSSIDRPMSSSTVTLDLGGSSLMTSSSNRPPSRSHLRTPSAGSNSEISLKKLLCPQRASLCTRPLRQKYGRRTDQSVPSGSWPRSSHSGLRGCLSDGTWSSRHEQESSLLIGLPYPSCPSSTTVLLPPHHLPLPHNTQQQLQHQQQYHHYRSSNLSYSGYSSTVTRDLLGIPVFTASSTPSTSSSDEASEGICADYGGSSSQGDEKESIEDEEEDTIYETLKWRGRVTAAVGAPVDATPTTRLTRTSVLPWRAASAPRHLSPSPAPPLLRHRSSMASASPLSSSGVFSASSSSSNLSTRFYLGSVPHSRPLMSSSMTSSPRRTPSRIPRPSVGAPHLARQMSASYGGRSASLEVTSSSGVLDGSRECLAEDDDDEEEEGGVRRRHGCLLLRASIRQASLDVLERATQKRTPRGPRAVDERCDATPRLRSLPPPSLTERRILTRRTQQPPPGYTADVPLAMLARSMRESFVARVRTPSPEPQMKKRKRKDPRAEQQLSLYRQTHTGRVQKPLVVARSRCICERITVASMPIDRSTVSKAEFAYYYNLAVLFAALAFLARCLITVVELSY
uniref:Uncharacterized protein n=1 Tax=Pristionchus pacificus TaxID=54126 RepID=A0A2A6CB39_PRIPA|eukprot:PDM75349.1 hypothetical protein PRIPAC_42526 [Pristionchus pacificus]